MRPWVSIVTPVGITTCRLLAASGGSGRRGLVISLAGSTPWGRPSGTGDSAGARRVQVLGCDTHLFPSAVASLEQFGCHRKLSGVRKRRLVVVYRPYNRHRNHQKSKVPVH